jgi:hypothetical protein
MYFMYILSIFIKDVRGYKRLVKRSILWAYLNFIPNNKNNFLCIIIKYFINNVR